MIHKTLGISPGGLTFGRDMMLPIPLLVDYNLICQKRQAVIDENNHHANLCRSFKDYTVGEEVLILVSDPAIFSPHAQGPFEITEVHTNGTITIRCAPDVFERINVRRVRPYLRRP